MIIFTMRNPKNRSFPLQPASREHFLRLVAPHSGVAYSGGGLGSSVPRVHRFFSALEARSRPQQRRGFASLRSRPTGRGGGRPLGRVSDRSVRPAGGHHRGSGHGGARTHPPLDGGQFPLLLFRIYFYRLSGLQRRVLSSHLCAGQLLVHSPSGFWFCRRGGGLQHRRDDHGPVSFLFDPGFRLAPGGGDRRDDHPGRCHPRRHPHSPQPGSNRAPSGWPPAPGPRGSQRRLSCQEPHPT